MVPAFIRSAGILINIQKWFKKLRWSFKAETTGVVIEICVKYPGGVT
jgi:hypothetical protein